MMKRLLIVAAVVGVAVVVRQTLPDIRRYLKMRRM